MNPEVQFIIEALEDVVADQPGDHPLRRVDRDNSLIYDVRRKLDLSKPVFARKGELEQANLVGVRSVSRDNEPFGTHYNVETDVVLSVRLEGLDYRSGGHIDPDRARGVEFNELYEDIREALYGRRTYPQDDRFRDAKLDIRITNEDYQSSDFQDYYRREFDLVVRGHESL